MKSFSSYILHQSIERCIGTYLRNISLLDSNRRQHFLSRLRLVRPGEYGFNFDSVFDCIEDIVETLEEHEYEGYEYVLIEYVLTAYKNKKEKKATYDFLSSIHNPDTLKYLAWDHLLCALCIIVRNIINYREVLENRLGSDIISRIKRVVDIDKLIEFHMSDPENIREHCGTIWVNTIGALRYLLEPIFNDPRDIGDVWYKTRSYYYDKPLDTNTIYAITHTIINESAFYTTPVRNDYTEESKIISRWIDNQRERGYDSTESLDLLAEAAMCLKMTDRDNILWSSVLDYLCTKTMKDGFLVFYKRDDFEETLNLNEHTNILYILLGLI